MISRKISTRGGAPGVDERADSLASVADDLGICKSTLTRWQRVYRDADLLSGPHDDVDKELRRLRKEDELLRQERDLLKKATAFFVKETSR